MENIKLIRKLTHDEIIEVDSHQLKLTNLDKIFWNEEKYTKGDLIEYYSMISSYILPYLQERPESLHRYPNGIYGKSFYQKDMDHLPPEWVETIPIISEDGKVTNYMIISDLSSLLYLINLGCIDVNPWNSRVGSLDKPDYLIIDLDPEDIPFDYIVKTALACKSFFEQLNITSYPKTSGSRGMHILIPTGVEYGYEQIRNFAEILVNFIHRAVPDFTSLERSPKNRQGKVYLDYLQNAEGQTLASPYSVRPKPHATVSMPLDWSEVKVGLSPQDFTIKTVPEILKKEGDKMKGIIGWNESIDIQKILEEIENN